MGIEIEHKFLVKNESWKRGVRKKEVCRQGYLVADKTKTVRVRIIGEKGFLTVKGSSIGTSRPEFEYAVPLSDAEALLALCEGRTVEKTRHYVEHAGLTWEVDVFEGANEGLVVAEIELESEGQPFDLPDWAGEEVSEDIRYYNACLAMHPFNAWSTS
jgi:adenylate cyclase